MNRRLGIPRHLATLRAKDIPALARGACREANLNYPVPSYMSQQDCEEVIREALPRKAAARKRTQPATGKLAAKSQVKRQHG